MWKNAISEQNVGASIIVTFYNGEPPRIANFIGKVGNEKDRQNV